MFISKISTKKVLLIILLLTILSSGIQVSAQSFLTEDELDYITKKNIIKAVSLNGAAPIQYAGSDGQVKGISKEVLDEISHMTGLVFEYQLYDTLEDMYKSGADIVFGMPPNYAIDGMVLSVPYLKTETILYLNSSIELNKLEDKIYAAVKGSDLPEGVKEERAIYFDTREDSLNAVESGKADYGYGNAYSVAFYVLQNNYKNIITVPREMESREYCVGFLKEDETLLSIINKSIGLIEDTHLQTLILNSTTQIERKITIPMIFDSYGIQVFLILLCVVIILLMSFIRNVQAKNQLAIQNERYLILAQTSNEYFFEYNVKDKRLELSENCIRLFGNIGNLSKLETLLRNAKASFEKELNQGFQVKISIGIALLAEEKSYEELLEVADRALYEAKANGGANIQFAKHNNMESEI